MNISADERYRDPEQRALAARRAGALGMPAEVVASVRRLSGGLTGSRLRAEHLDRIGREGCVVLTTGQQLGLFGGPLLTFYKALTVVRAARALAAETGRPVVPLFWLQAEDHDLAEINSCVIPPPPTSGLSAGAVEAPLTFEIFSGTARASRSSVAVVVLGPEIDPVREDLIRRLGGLPYSDETAHGLRRHYRPEATFVEAFAGWLGEVFAEEGLLFLNPRDPALAPVFRPFFQRALADHREMTARLLQRGEELRGAEGREREQVFVRDDSPLFFYHPDGAEGPRFRLKWNGRSWSFVGREGEIAPEALAAFLETEPGRFSSSALLRPLIQDSILPSAGYVGGEAELRYLRQIEPLYPLFGRDRPLAIPRARFVLREPRARRLLDQLGLETADVLNDESAALEALFARRVDGDASPEALEARLKGPIAALFQALGPDLARVNPGLVPAARRGEEKIARVLSGLKERYAAALLEKHKVTRSQFDRARQLLYPGGIPQERVYATVAFLARHGPGLKAAVSERIDPFAPAPSLQVLDL